jgi:hypothetical protein
VDEGAAPANATDPHQNPFDYARRRAEEVQLRARVEKEEEQRQEDGAENIREFEQAF